MRSMKALKVAAGIVLVCALALVVMFGSFVLTMMGFAALGWVGGGWELLTILVWLLEMVFVSVFAAEYFG